jgi:uncharacterized protein (DUF433 family)
MACAVIVIDLNVMNGMPCFVGTRVRFKNLIDYLKGGHSLAEFLGEFPTIAREMAVQAIEEARIRCSAESMRILRVRVHASRLPIQFFRR